jgi:hypothetical protein
MEPIGSPLFFIANSQYVIGSYTNVKKGKIIFIPSPNPNDTEKISIYFDSLLNLTEELQKKPEYFILPDWSKIYSLPNEHKQKNILLSLEEELQKITEEVIRNKNIIDDIEKNKILFTGSGYALEEQAKKVFEELGFTATKGEIGRDDFILQYNDKIAVVEVKGTRKSAAESHARQLEQWVSQYYLQNNGAKAKGILVANAFNDILLSERKEAPFPDQMLSFSQKREHCLITGLQLLGLYLDCKEDNDKRQKMIELIFDTNGIFPEYQKWNDFLSINDM